MLWLSSGHRTPAFQIPSSNLADLEVVPEEIHDHPTSDLDGTPASPPITVEDPLAELDKSTPVQESFVDPAILSIGKPPASKIKTIKKEDRKDSLATATLSEPFNDLSLESLPEETINIEASKQRRGPRIRKAKKSQAPPETSTLPTQSTEELKEISPVSARGSKASGEANRRQTYLTVNESQRDTAAQSTRKSKVTSRISNRRRNLDTSETQNGWATEDATDIQELGDFDFEANLSKFDKLEIFKQLKQDDTTAMASRLVSHNRLPQPKAGTAGGKNLHWTENVLDSPPSSPRLTTNGVSRWKSEAGESEDELNEHRRNMERSGKRNASRSRSSVRKAPSRKGSGLAPKMAPPAVSSQRQSSFDVTGSPKPKRTLSNSPYIGGIPASSRPSLRIQGSNKLCPCLSPLQMLEFEQYAVSELGLTEDILLENAARGIAEAAIKVLHAEKKENGSHIIVITGNHRSGARTLAGSRHLRNHGFKVTATVMGLEREEDLLDPVRQQANAYRKAGGTLFKPNELLDSMKSASKHPALCIDSLLGIHLVFDDLRTDDQAWCFEMILLANRMDTRILSIDVPSGLDASTGEVTLAENAPLAFYPQSILSLGAPKPWLLAMLREAGVKDNPDMMVADIGISNIAWRRLGNRRNKGVDFGTEWVVKLRYQPGVE